ncbi:MAG: RNA polymerase sigma factor [Bacteroidia bacterium]|jgi:RNA polymerase sigma-70 factor (ECF subfamily)|nr:RNA polymerase sigma factor [Bacteroidia bacterium]
MGEILKTDEEILRAFKQPDTQIKAYEWLLDGYQKRIYWHVRRIVISHDDADDVSQNTLIKIWEHLHEFKGESKLYTWIFRIATNEAIAFLNKKKNHLSLDDAAESLGKYLTPEGYFNGDEAALKLQQAILQLPEKQRLVFNMKYFENIKYEDMSEILNTSVGALKASYHHATQKIEQQLKNIKPLSI